MTRSRRFTALLGGLFALLLIAAPDTSHAAKSVSVLGGPEPFDLSDPRALQAQAARPPSNANAPCFTEPKGFRNQIHFEHPCKAETGTAVKPSERVQGSEYPQPKRAR